MFSLVSILYRCQRVFWNEPCNVSRNASRNALDESLPSILDGFSTNSGNFSLYVETAVAAENDSCLDAEPLDVGSTEFGSTLLATSDQELPYCGP